MIKVAINGFGRIGRPVLRRILDNHPHLEIIAINDLTDAKILSHLLKYDSLYGIYKKAIRSVGKSIFIDTQEIKVFAEKDPLNLPWRKLGIDIVFECTGLFTDFNGASKHLKAGAKKVIISAPSKSEQVLTFILGVNQEKYNPKRDNVVSMGSCTTNCLAPVAKVLEDNLGIQQGFMTTVHSYTNDQRILDLAHKDLRRARAAALNIIPTITGAAKTISKVIPQLKGKLDGIALRVPCPVVSVLDLICRVKKDVKAEQVNIFFEKAAKTDNFKGILKIEKKPLVSSDYIGDSHSAIIDTELTMAKNNLVKIIAWYDNEWAYACRLAEFAEFINR